ncbi:MAG: MarR family transcriptional regulator [candidate division KSB1 bacterium]|nr:MarR family transcriptional regulator [candidate division KSB1 bacterium]
MSQQLIKLATRDRERYTACQKQSLKLWVVLARCFNTFAHALKFEQGDLTLPQFGVLEALAHLGPMKMCDIAGKLLMSGGNVTGVVDRLEQKGLVRRIVDTEDRRTFVIHLTAAGRKLIDDIFPRHALQIEKLTSALSAKEKGTLIALLKKLGHSIQRPN